jgi:hypothetical protein
VRTKYVRVPMLAQLLLVAGCTAPNPWSTDMTTMETPTRTIEIELLALDLDTCGRCTGTDRNLEGALASVANVLRETGAAVKVTKRVIATAPEAERFRLVSSPTIRVDGRDIALELRESNCGDCGDICGCEGGVDCRVWVWQGKEHLEAPKPLIVDAVLRAYAAPPAGVPAEPYHMPENLRTYFAAAAAKLSGSAAGTECCDRSACCEPTAKEECCGTAAASGVCGCR